MGCLTQTGTFTTQPLHLRPKNGKNGEEEEEGGGEGEEEAVTVAVTAAV